VNNALALTGTATTYTFQDSAEPITLLGDTAGWTVSPFGAGSTVVGPSAGYLSILINTLDGNNAIRIGSAGLANTLDFLKATVDVQAGPGANTLSLFDNGGTTNNNVFIGASQITGLAPTTITYGGAYGQIMVSGSILATVPETFTILNPSGPFTL